MVTGSRPSLAQQVLIGITISVKGEGAGKGEGRRSLSLPASFALVLALLFPPPATSVFLLSVSILIISFHFSCTGCTRINNYRPHLWHAPTPPSPQFHFYLPIHVCLSLEASSCFSHSFILSSFHLCTTSRWKIKSSKGRKTGKGNVSAKGRRGRAKERQGRTIKTILVSVRGCFSAASAAVLTYPAPLFSWICLAQRGLAVRP